MDFREKGDRQDHEVSEEELDGREALASLVQRETPVNPDLLVQWVKLVFLVQKVQEGLLERLVCLVFLERMEHLVPLVREVLQENMDHQGLLVCPVLLGLQGLLVSLVNLESLVLRVLLVFLVILGDLESLERRDHLDHQVHKEGLVFLDLLACLDSLGKEDCLDYLECLALKEKWDLLAHLDLRVTRVPKEHLVLRGPLVLKEDKALLDHLESLVKRVKLGYLDSLDQQEGMACQDQEVCQESQDLRVTLERMVSKVKLDLLALRDSRVERGRLVPLEAQDLEDRGVKLDLLDLLVTKALLE